MSEEQPKGKTTRKTEVWRDTHKLFQQGDVKSRMGFVPEGPAPGRQKTFAGREGVPSLLQDDLGTPGVRGLRDKQDPSDPDTAPGPVKVTKENPQK